MTSGADRGREAGGAEGSRELVDAARRAIDAGTPDAALPLLRRAAELASSDASVAVQLGRAYNNLRQPEAARAAFEEAVRLDPSSAQAWNGLGHVCRGLGDMDTAGEAFRCAVSLEPGSAGALANLGSVHLARGETDEGLRLLRRAAEIDPSDLRSRCLLGDALQSLGHHGKAESAYGEALAIDPEHADALAGMGAVMDALGRFDEAERLLRQALSRRPGDPVAAASLVHVLELQGRSEEVLEVIERCGWARPPGWAVVAEARQLESLGRPEQAEERLARLAPGDMDAATRASACFLRGRILDARGRYAEAFAMFEQANRAQPADFDPGAFRQTIDSLIGFFTAERLAELPRSGCDSDRPVFIVGMPRSGTSLVEQMLGAHSRVHACGERTDFYRLPRELAGGRAADRWPACLAEVDAADLSAAASAYLEGAGGSDGSSLRVTDKLPANFLNLGLAQLVFPRARVIYCRRDPMDTGLSCFEQDFRSAGMGFARRLAYIGLYQQGCLRMMTHWGRVLDLPIHTVDYEELVADPGTAARAMVEFVGLDWEEGCLRFHESGRVVRTASHQQVRVPIYTSSVGRWTRYRKWLGPLREALDSPWPEATGPSGP